MRQRKLRAIQKGSRPLWNYGDLVHTLHATYIVKLFSMPSGTLPVSYFIEINPETIGEYTGLNDKKRTEEFPIGQDIYEGDICKESDLIYSIVWDKVMLAWSIDLLGNEYEFLHEVNFAKIEVIGNIHEHPNLLK